MPRYNVKYNDMWACFSTITDGFITEFMDKFEYEKWRKYQYGKQTFQPTPAKNCNIMTMKEASFSIRLNRTHDEAIECLLECGLPEKECRKIICDMESQYYCPIPKDNGKFECPNCHRTVDREQRSCEGDDCCLDFVWK